MLAWFDGLQGVQTLFAVCAVIGGILLVFRMIAMFVGLDHAGANLDVGGDLHAGGDGGVHHGTDWAFKIFTIQSMSAFLTLFGLVGLLVYPEFGTPVAIGGGVAAGVVAAQATEFLVRAMLSLQSTGSLTPADAIGTEGTVYLTVDPESGGKVQVTVGGRLREYEAVSDNGERLETGAPIRVVKADGNALVVKRKAS
jgi:membrane protein implicated in regulation of membrane protease activity